MFHPRGMGPRGMRPGMRPFAPPRGPPFDPREADSFFRPFDDMRSRPGPHIRPPFGPMGPPTMHGPDGPWRSQEGGGGVGLPASWPGQESDGHGQRENHLPRDKQKLIGKHQDYKNISENRNRNRKSRWGNVSPPLMDDEIPPPPPPPPPPSSEDVEKKTKKASEGGGGELMETKDNFDNTSSSAVLGQHDHLMQREPHLTARREQDVEGGDGENELASISNDEGGNRETSYRNDEGRTTGNLYEIDADHFPNDDLALKQREEEQCEYEAPIPAENSAQQSAVQPIEIGHVSENHSDQSVEQQVDSL